MLFSYMRDRKMRWQRDTFLFALRLWTCLEVLSCSPASATGKAAADYYVKSLPGQPDGPLLNMHAGYLGVFLLPHSSAPAKLSLTAISKLPQNIMAICFSGFLKIATLRIGREPLSGSMVDQAVARWMVP